MNQTSEELYGITKQPPPTCPIIDEALREVDLIAKCIRGYERADESELREMISSIEWRIGLLSGYGKTGLLEDIRKNVIEIRAWGEEWKNTVLHTSPTPL